MAKKTLLSTQTLSKISTYKQSLLQAGIPVEKMIVFGSHVRGTQKPWSDIDVCVISPLFTHDRQADRVRLMKLITKDIMEIEPHPYSPVNFNNPWDPLAHEIRLHGIVV